ncbi:16831_t:CDS:2 [Funneliformis caledonium]|uniref:16831_t:CDS:1 n=1 Tax=Funneliformis caledonium TaxID=1117310 RepID=A0A9N9B246_9GLOM|nr:16831_t:CDS:2 [Funneliformis caledonium]
MTDIYTVFYLLASSSSYNQSKRKRENHIITTEGPLHPRQGQSYIIHDLYQAESRLCVRAQGDTQA